MLYYFYAEQNDTSLPKHIQISNASSKNKKKNDISSNGIKISGIGENKRVQLEKKV